MILSDKTSQTEPPLSMSATKFNENPVNAKEAARILGMGPGTISALKRSMGITSRKIFVSELRMFLRKNPNWRTTLIYHRRSCKCMLCMKKRAAKILRQTKVPAVALPSAPQESFASLPGESAAAGLGKPGIRVSTSAKGSLGAKLRFLRGSRGANEVAAKTGLSRESVYRIERGDTVKLVTVKTLARALEADRTETLDLFIAWIKQTLAEDAEDLLIEPRSKETTAYASVLERQASQVRALLEQFSETQRDQLIQALQNREIMNGINIMVRLAGRNSQLVKTSTYPDACFRALE